MMRNGNGGLRGIQKVGFLSSSSSPPSRRGIHFPVKCLSDFNDYAVLGLSPFASKTDVKFAYKRLALKVWTNMNPLFLHSSVFQVSFSWFFLWKWWWLLILQYHPDVIRGDHVAEKHRMFRDIKSAYEVLFIINLKRNGGSNLQFNLVYDS